jgi:Zn-dependent M28 family amino/carboxypeptidase
MLGSASPAALQPRPNWRAALTSRATCPISSSLRSHARHDFGSGVNVVGTLPGSGTVSSVIISAHYDHIAGCPGADDNASGVAGVLEAARVLSSTPLDGAVVVACWDLEESGLHGSRAYATRAAQQGELVTVAFVLDMIGYWNAYPGSQGVPAGYEVLFPAQVDQIRANDRRGDFIAAVTDEAAQEPATRFEAHALAVGMPAIVFEVPEALKLSAATADLRRSDHAPFWEQDFPAVFVTDTADYRNPHYHCRLGTDAVSDIDVQFASQVVQATVGATAETLGLPSGL